LAQTGGAERQLGGGERDAATTALTDILARFRALAAADPENVDLQRQVAATLADVAAIDATGGRPVQARAGYDAATVLLRQLIAADPTDIDLKVAFARLLVAAGRLQAANGDAAGAGKLFDESLAISRAFAASDPANEKLQFALLNTLFADAILLVTERDLAGARAVEHEGLAILQRLTKAPDATDAALPVQVADALNSDGEVRAALGNLPGAREAFEQSLALRTRLALAAPDDVSLQLQRALTLTQLANVETRQGATADALASLRQGLDLARRLASVDPRDGRVQRALGLAMNRLAALPGGGVTWNEAAAQWRSMREHDLLRPADEGLAKNAETNAAKDAAGAAAP
jgi:tetratricopeptide (TPR) repeat protein